MKIYILRCLILVTVFKYSQGRGLCAFTCTVQGRVFVFPQLNNDESRLDYSGSDPTSYSATIFGETYTGYCYARTGPFYAMRRIINGTYFYTCAKDAMFNQEHDVVVYYSTPFVYFPGNPTICDICTGKGFGPPVAVKELECNIPHVCPVTDPAIQIPCDSCTSSESSDDGLCCPEKRLKN
ncbi:unnamed protein product [Mytilus coruscus]|uniref:Uncharacterized protein n=1 Tax=Mytilus coruscus TaxID=42192 RepID=A0A6J8EP59_MYTCO|nr:unnamed protein product [Mytilus coruscus]